MRTLTDVEEVATPSADQLEIVAIVAYFGQATRALIERYRGEDSESLLERLVAEGCSRRSATTMRSVRRTSTG